MDKDESLFDVAEVTYSASEEDECCDEAENPSVTSYSIAHEKAVTLGKVYILDSCLSEGMKIFGSLSNKTCVAFDVETFSQIAKFADHFDAITGIKICPDDENLVITSSLDGTAKLWDVRLKRNCVQEYKDDSGGGLKLKPLTSFDVSSKKPLIVAGTEQCGDVYILFWDKRSTKLLGGYWQSHHDDVTQVQFHPFKDDFLATGSLDGLINVFDLSQECEDDALQFCLNTESSVYKTCWFTHGAGADGISCTTYTEDLQLWCIEDGSPYETFSRSKIAECINRNRVDNCYVVDVLCVKGNELYVLAGSKHQRGECLNLLKVEDNKMKCWADFRGNKQILRTCCFYKNPNILVTGGESGIFTVWKSEEKVPETAKSDLKLKTKIVRSNNAVKPYEVQ